MRAMCFQGRKVTLPGEGGGATSAQEMCFRVSLVGAWSISPEDFTTATAGFGSGGAAGEED